MPFKKGNKYGFTSSLLHKLDKEPICFKGYEGQKDKLKAIPNWQEKLRKYVDCLIKQDV